MCSKENLDLVEVAEFEKKFLNSRKKLYRAEILRLSLKSYLGRRSGRVAKSSRRIVH